MHRRASNVTPPEPAPPEPELLQPEPPEPELQLFTHDIVEQLAAAQLDDIDLSEHDPDATPELLLKSRPRFNKSRRPPMFLPTPWSNIHTAHPVGATEAPFVTIEHIDWELSHTNACNMMPEREDVARLQRIPLPNRPVRRDPRPYPEQPATTWRPARGSCAELFTTFTFSHQAHGDWVRSRLQASKGGKRNRASSWTLTPAQLVDEIILWYETVDNDIKAAKRWIQGGSIGKFRPKAKLWIIPQTAFSEDARGIIWHSAPWFAASKADRPSIQIEPHDWSQAEAPPWDVDALMKLALDSGLEDMAGMQNLCGVGTFLPFTGEMSTVLAPPATGMYTKYDVAANTTLEEIAEGWISAPLMGPHFLPAKLSPRNVATTFRSGARTRIHTRIAACVLILVVRV